MRLADGPERRTNKGMGINLFRQALVLSIRVAITAVPKKQDRVALTLHNIPPEHYEWANQVIGHIKAKYGFLDPGNVMFGGRQHPSSPRVLLTFDDGFASHRHVVEEVLEPLGVRGLFFISHDFIGLSKAEAHSFAQRHFYPSRKIVASDGDATAMNWQDLEWLISKGHTLGAHTFMHDALADLPLDRQREEIIASADRLEQRLGYPIRQFAYPFGSLASIDENSVDFARERFDLAYSNIRGMLGESPSSHFLFRQNLVPGSPMWMVDAMIEGRLDWRYRGARNEAFTRFSERGLHR